VVDLDAGADASELADAVVRAVQDLALASDHASGDKRIEGLTRRRVRKV